MASITSKLRKNAGIISTVLVIVIILFVMYVASGPGTFSENFLSMANYVQSSIYPSVAPNYFQQEFSQLQQAEATQGINNVQPSVDPGTGMAGTLQEIYGPAAASFQENNPLATAELTPQDLLPGNNPVSFSGGENMGAKNFLSATSLIGIDTVGSSMKNPNLQLRSDPPIPQITVSPWQQTSITPDKYARPFEMGLSGSNVGL